MVSEGKDMKLIDLFFFFSTFLGVRASLSSHMTGAFVVWIPSNEGERMFSHVEQMLREKGETFKLTAVNQQKSLTHYNEKWKK